MRYCLIDEVDRFLQDRRNALQSWEITAVNEMLTQMESYNGIFIASTNLMTNLDQAALRRFDLKIKFKFLKPEQAWALFQRHCSVLGINNIEATLHSHINHLDKLTPGDFAPASV